MNDINEVIAFLRNARSMMTASHDIVHNGVRMTPLRLWMMYANFIYEAQMKTDPSVWMEAVYTYDAAVEVMSGMVGRYTREVMLRESGMRISIRNGSFTYKKFAECYCDTEVYLGLLMKIDTDDARRHLKMASQFTVGMTMDILGKVPFKRYYSGPSLESLIQERKNEGVGPMHVEYLCGALHHAFERFGVGAYDTIVGVNKKDGCVFTTKTIGYTQRNGEVKEFGRTYGETKEERLTKFLEEVGGYFMEEMRKKS